MDDTAQAPVAEPTKEPVKSLPQGTDYSLTEGGQDALAEAFGFKGEPAEPEAEEETESGDETDEVESEAEEPEQIEDEADEPAEEPTYTVKVDGEEVKVPLTELLKGYSRQSDYTRKTQEVAELRKQTDSELQQIREERVHAAQLLQTLEFALKSQQPQEPDWDHLKATDPIGYMMARDEHRARQEQLSAIAQQQAFIQQQFQQEQVRELQGKLKSEAEKLTAAIPEWKDATKAKAEKQLLREYATKLGYQPEEVDGIADHRAVLLLRKAWLFDQAMQNRKTAAQKPSQGFAKPGQPVTQNKGKVARVNDLKAKLAKSGDERDFTALIHNLL